MAEVETLMLANHAEATNGLLYVLGGAWTHHWRLLPVAGEQAQPSSFSVAAVFLVEPDEVGRRHSFLFRIVPEVGEEILRIEGTFAVAAPADPGTVPYRSAFAAHANLVFGSSGAHRLVAEVDSSSRRVVDFWVHDRDPEGQGSEGDTPPVGGYL
jgi:hypothetical protein